MHRALVQNETKRNEASVQVLVAQQTTCACVSVILPTYPPPVVSFQQLPACLLLDQWQSIHQSWRNTLITCCHPPPLIVPLKYFFGSWSASKWSSTMAAQNDSMQKKLCAVMEPSTATTLMGGAKNNNNNNTDGTDMDCDDNTQQQQQQQDEEDEEESTTKVSQSKKVREQFQHPTRSIIPGLFSIRSSCLRGFTSPSLQIYPSNNDVCLSPLDDPSKKDSVMVDPVDPVDPVVCLPSSSSPTPSRTTVNQSIHPSIPPLHSTPMFCQMAFGVECCSKECVPWFRS